MTASVIFFLSDYSRAEKGQGFLEEEGLTTLSWEELRGAEAGEKVKVISSRHDATVCARSSTGFELLLLINFQPRRWKSFQFGKDRKYANWPHHNHYQTYTTSTLLAPPAPLLPYQHLVVTTRCIDESWCIDYKNTIPTSKPCAA